MKIPLAISLIILIIILCLKPGLILVLCLGIPLFLFGFVMMKSQSPDKVSKKSPYFDQTKNETVQYDEGPFFSSDRTICHPVRVSAEGIASRKPTTVCALMAQAASKCPNKPALRVERPVPPLNGRRAPPPLPLDQWKVWTWKQYNDECRVAARAFISLGLEPFDGVSILGFNSPEWVMGEVACMFAGGIAAGIYPTDTTVQVQFKAKHSATVIAVVQSYKKADVFLTAAQDGGLPKLRAIVIWDPSPGGKVTQDIPENIKVCNWSDLSTIADGTSDDTLQQRIDAQEPGNICCYIYTSGTTGQPKAVMVTHDNITWMGACIHNVFDTQSILGMEEEEERILSYLPLSHVAGMLVDIINPMVCTAERKAWMSTNFARVYDLKVGSLADRLRAVRPTAFLGVPRVWEKISEKMKSLGASTKGIKLKVAKFAKGQGLKHAMACQMGGSGEYPMLYPLAELLLSQIKQKLGLDKCKFGLSGAAPIQKDTVEYFAALGIQINEAYGMSESCGVMSLTTNRAHIWGSTGYCLPGGEVKIFQCRDNDINEKKECKRAVNLMNPTEDEQGEICYRGRNVMPGYMANPDLGPDHEALIHKKNSGAIDAEGWLHSGDKGCMDARGMVKITGRYKELIIGAGGENVAPVPIENNIKKICPIISNIMMLGDKRKFNVCFVTLKAVGATGEKPGNDNLDKICHSISSGVTTISGAMEDDKFIKTITNAIKATNANGDVCPSNASKIQKFSILPHDFSVETGELTATLKLKRSVVQKKHDALIERMYQSKDIYNPFFLQ